MKWGIQLIQKKRMKSFFLSLRFLFLCSLIEKLFLFLFPSRFLKKKHTENWISLCKAWSRLKRNLFSFIFFTSHNFHLIFFFFLSFFFGTETEKKKNYWRIKNFSYEKKIFRFSLSGTRRLTESCFFISSFCML